MNSVKWLKITGFYSLTIVVIVGLFNYIVDPFYQYRFNSFYSPIFIPKLQRYINPGLAKNCDYDTVILGSSTSENVVISDVEKILGYKKPIKLCIGGSSAHEQSLILRVALKHHKINHVLYGLDTFVYGGEVDRIRHGKETFPFYLYDDNIFNDFKYLFSFDTLKKSFYTLYFWKTANKNNIKYNYNRMYQWQQNVPVSHFTKNWVMSGWKERKLHYQGNSPKNNLKYYKESFKVNFLSLIKKYSKTEFVIYFPPCSILMHKFEQEERMFNDRLEFKKYIVDVCSNFKNVKIYDFQAEQNITHNFNMFHDFYHFHSNVNRWILMQIKNDKYRVNRQNINLYLNKLRTQVYSYPFPYSKK